MATEWNPPPPAELAGFPLHERFAAQAARTPDAVALTAPPPGEGMPPGEREGGGELTYGELAGRAGRLAWSEETPSSGVVEALADAVRSNGAR